MMAARRLLQSFIFTTLLFIGPVSSYPSMAGSCEAPLGVHVIPKEKKNHKKPSTGTFTVSGTNPTLLTKRVSLQYTKLRGFLVKAYSNSTGLPVGKFVSIPSSMMYYQGCALNPEAAVTTAHKKFHGSGISLEWQASSAAEFHDASFQAWAVHSTHDFRQFRIEAAGGAPPVRQCRVDYASTLPLFAATVALLLAATALHATARCCACWATLTQSRLLGYSTGLLALLAVFLAAGLLSFWLAEGVASGAVPTGAACGRALGTVTVVCLALLSLPVSRTGLWTRLLGCSFERALATHRILGRITMLTIGGHGYLMFRDYGRTVLQANVTCWGYGHLYGVLAAACFLFLGIFSVWDKVRRLNFELFYVTHFSFLLGYLFSALHVFWVSYAIALPCLLYAVDRALRMRRSRSSVHLISAKILPGGVTRLELERPSWLHLTGRDPGAYVFIMVPQLSRLQWHPFSISSPHMTADDAAAAHAAEERALALHHATTPTLSGITGHELTSVRRTPAAATATATADALEGKAGGSGISGGGGSGNGLLVTPAFSSSRVSSFAPPADNFTLHIRDMGPGTWTRQLTQLARRCRHFRVHVDGPHGSLQLRPEGYPTIVCVGGGIGVTPLASLLGWFLVRRQRLALAAAASPYALPSHVVGADDPFSGGAAAAGSSIGSIIGPLGGGGGAKGGRSGFSADGGSSSDGGGSAYQQAHLGGNGSAAAKQALLASTAATSAFPQRMVFVWSVRQAQCLGWMAPLLRAAAACPDVTLHLHVTRAKHSADIQQQWEAQQQQQRQRQPLGSSESGSLEEGEGEEGEGGDSSADLAATLASCTYPGRPNLPRLLNAVPQTDSSRGRGVAVLACGPPQMIAEAHAEAAARKFHFHEETFLM